MAGRALPLGGVPAVPLLSVPQNIGKSMSCQEFISNLNGLHDGGNFPKELLKVRCQGCPRKAPSLPGPEPLVPRGFCALAWLHPNIRQGQGPLTDCSVTGGFVSSCKRPALPPASWTRLLGLQPPKWSQSSILRPVKSEKHCFFLL